MNIAVLVSGSGTNLQAIIDKCAGGEIKGGTVKVVISNKKDAYALERARKHGIEAVYINPKEYADREAYDREIVRIMKEKETGLVVLAGYLKWITPYFVNEYSGKIMNVHPSLLPSFKGLHGIKDAYEYGVKVTGVTVHFVDETEDGGAVIIQEAVRIEDNDSLESLEEKIHAVEHRIYPEAIDKFINGKISVDGRKVTINK